MNRRKFLLYGGLGLAACDRNRQRRLNVFNWSSYIDPRTLDQFSAEYGVRVRYGVYESNEEMLAKVMSGNSGWDVVFPTHNRITPMAKRGLLASLDHRQLPNLANLDQLFQRPMWDPTLRYSTPYMWNATGIACSASLISVIQSWADLWSERVRGRLTMLDDQEDVIGACLLKLRLSFDATQRSDLLAAKRQAIEEKRYLRAYLNAEVRDQLIAGDVVAAQLWSTTAEQAIAAEQATNKLSFVYPSEGFPLYCDNAVILAESHRRDLAHQFLNFLLRPQIAAANATVGETATCNGKARPLLSTAQRESKSLYPPIEVLHRGVWPVALPSEIQRFKDRIWTEIKAA